jgi:hypothetical protein
MLTEHAAQHAFFYLRRKRATEHEIEIMAAESIEWEQRNETLKAS